MNRETIDHLNAVLADRYRIVREVGEGGMATVFLANDLRHGRKVAVKVLRPELAAAVGADRFLREIRIAAQLQHPHVLPLYDSGDAGGSLYYVMPYVEGESLRARLTGHGELPVAEAVRILRDVVDALTEAHQHGIVHRDIKPENVLLRGRHALVADFGVAKALSDATGRQQVTTAGVSLGTPAYMAPEQAAADPHLDHRVDIYAVGVLAYEMLTGRRPFEASTPQQMLAAHVTESPRDVTEHRPAVPLALASLVMRCLEKNPADRWQTAEELLAALETVLTPSGGTTPTSVTGGPDKHHGNRRRWVVAAAVTALVAVGGYWAFRRNSVESAPRLATMKRLTANPLESALTGAAISPDGRYLAYADPQGVFVQTVATGETNQLTLPDSLTGWDIGWYPDGTRLFLLGSTSRGRLDLYSMPLLGGAPVRISKSVLRAAIAPDGSRFAVIRASRATGEQFHEIWTMGGRGEDPRLLLAADSGEAFWDLTWSPDGQRLAVGVVPRNGTNAIRTIALSDLSSTTLIEDARLFQNWTGILPFTWCANGRFVYSLRDGRPAEATSNVWTVETDVRRGVTAGAPRRVTQQAASNVRRLTATADCSSIAAMMVQNQADVWVAGLSANGTSLSDEVQVTFDLREDYPVGWLPGGDLVLTSARSGQDDLYRWTPGARGVRPFVVGDSTSRGAWAWGAGRFLYRSGGIWAVGEEGGPGTRLTRNEVAALQCARQGSCVTGHFDGPDYVFSTLDPATGEQKEIRRIDARPPFTNFALSPDGKTAAVVHLNDNVIRLIDLTSNGETDLRVPGWSMFEYVSWSADGREVFTNPGFAASGSYPVLLAVGLDRSVHVLRERANVWHVYPKASPDGKYLAFAAMSFQGNAWLLTGF